VAPPRRLHADLQQLARTRGSARRLALAVGLDPQRVQGWLREERYPTAEALEQLITACTVAPDVAAAWRTEAAAHQQAAQARAAATHWPADRPRPTNTCAECGRTFTYAPYRETPEKRPEFCSRACADAGQRDSYRPPSALGRFVYARWRDARRASGVSLAAFAQQIGLSPGGLRSLFTKATQLQRTVDTVRRAYPDAPIPATTETDRRRAATWQAYETRWAKPGTAAFRKLAAKSAASRRGLPHAAAATAKMLKTKAETLVEVAGQPMTLLEQETARIRAQAARVEVRARRYLGTHLRWHPDTSLEQLRALAAAYAARTQNTAAAVWTYWQPSLEQRGLLERAGAKPNEDRHRQVEELMAQRPRTASGKLRGGKRIGRFWDMAAEQVYERELAQARDRQQPAETVQRLDGDGLYEWYRRHIRTPGRCALATGG